MGGHKCVRMRDAARAETRDLLVHAQAHAASQHELNARPKRAPPPPPRDQSPESPPGAVDGNFGLLAAQSFAQSYERANWLFKRQASRTPVQPTERAARSPSAHHGFGSGGWGGLVERGEGGTFGGGCPLGLQHEIC